MQIKHNIEVTLFNPQIPQNTGNIGRLCVNTGVKLNLILPIGFSLEEKYIRRSGLDYWKFLDLTVYENWDQFIKDKNRNTLFFLSTKGKINFWQCNFTTFTNSQTTHLIFGSETSGLTPKIYHEFSDRLFTIPMFGEHSRSYNLANSVSIVLFESIRQFTYN